MIIKLKINSIPKTLKIFNFWEQKFGKPFYRDG